MFNRLFNKSIETISTAVNSTSNSTSVLSGMFNATDVSTGGTSLGNGDTKSDFTGFLVVLGLIGVCCVACCIDNLNRGRNGYRRF